MQAVVAIGGKQYLVEPQGRVTVEKLTQAVGSPVHFDRVLLVADGADVTVGTPTVPNAKVTGEVVAHVRAPKVSVIKFKAKVRYRRHRSHRQQQTVVRITEITS